ncbi:uncharacterized protein MONBRDRAFT_37707, partial [Monosiga brevicollis MX1]
MSWVVVIRGAILFGLALGWGSAQTFWSATSEVEEIDPSCSVPGQSAICSADSVVVKDDNINVYEPLVTGMLIPDARAYHSAISAHEPTSNTTFLVRDSLLHIPSPHRASHGPLGAHTAIISLLSAWQVIFGGCQDSLTANTSGHNSGGALNDLWIFDLLKRAWFNVTFEDSFLIPRPRFAHACSPTCAKNAMICFGGLIPRKDISSTCEHGVPRPRGGLDAVEFSDEIWLLMGSVANHPRQWYSISPTPNKPVPMARAGHTLTSTSRGLILFGGAGLTTDNGTTTMVPLADLWILSCPDANHTNFNQTHLTWRRLNATAPNGTDIPARHSHTATVVATDVGGVYNETLIIFGGAANTEIPVEANSSYFNDIWALNLADLDNLQWVKVGAATFEGEQPMRRHSHVAAATRDNFIFVHGGASGDGDHLRDSWLMDPTAEVMRTWTNLSSWYYPGNSAFTFLTYATPRYLADRDRWGHTATMVDSDLQMAETILLYGGFYAEEYYSYTTTDMTEYYPRPQNMNLVLFLQDDFQGPFHRVEHTTLRYGRPRMQDPSGDVLCDCLDTDWTWNNLTYRGCQRPLGMEDFICPVGAACSQGSCWPQYGGGDALWNFCNDDKMLLFGGLYDGDVDHQAIADVAGVAWLYNIDEGSWMLDEIDHTVDVNTNSPGPIYHCVSFFCCACGPLGFNFLICVVCAGEHRHSMVRLSGYTLNEPLPIPGLAYGNHDAYVIFGGNSADINENTIVGRTFMYTPARLGITGQWSALENHMDESMVNAKLPRAGHAAAVHNYLDPQKRVQSDMYVFGGYYMRAWATHVSITGPSMFLKYNVHSQTWSSLSNNAKATLPPPRFFSTLLTFSVPFPMLVLFGGEQALSRQGTRFLNDVWIYDLKSEAWFSVSPLPDPVRGSVAPREGFVAVAHGTKMILYGGKRLINGTLMSEAACAASSFTCSYCDLWELDLSKMTRQALLNNSGAAQWRSLLDDTECDDFPSLRHAAGVISSGALHVFGGFQGTRGEPSSLLWRTRPGCINGTQSHSYFLVSCEHCPKSSYATGDGHHCCSPCTEFLSTNTTGADSPAMCNVCRHDFCNHHGTCSLVGGAPVCSCTFGFTALDNCKQPWWIIGGALLIATLVVGAVARSRWVQWQRHKKLRRAQLTQMQRQLTDASKGWLIREEELVLGERIDRRTRGMYGEVYRAKMGNFDVAVKKLSSQLMMLDAESYTAEFEREIQFMRSVRHPNLGNLLVTNTYVVKVADFGTSKLLDQAREDMVDLDGRSGVSRGSNARSRRRQPSRSAKPRSHEAARVGINGEAEPLLTSGVSSFSRSRDGDSDDATSLARSYTMTRGVGTPLYQAPEVLERQDYGIKVDVYSYGIVLNEIYTRTTPFSHLMGPDSHPSALFKAVME